MALKLTCSIEYFQDYTNGDLWLTLTFLMARSNMEKCLNIYFKESFEDFDLKMGIDSFLNEFMKICEYKRSRSFFDL